MASIVPGYNYDIFISYRQKDNKGDRWVSEFVEALKTELESTFKEEISVYFDINPHDGLLETHDVDASLKDKLKCLVFIPIISRTYCDPKSFAWEHEFKAFVEEASHNQFGLKIKLPNGNVANRIIPIQIHELHLEDKTLIEKEMGGVLRAIEFIYKEPGVNRPLTGNDDKEINLNKTKYKNQINKVANAIDEIIHNLKEVHPEVVKEKEQQKELLSKPKQVEERRELERPIKLNRQKKMASIIVAVVLLLMAVIIAYPKIYKKNTLENLRSADGRISVAIMPFQNMTNDTTWNVWQDGIQDMLINSLSSSVELRVKQTESIGTLIQGKGITNYASITPSIASTISQKLDANVFIYGSIKQAGPTIRINAQLIDSKTEEVVKSIEIVGSSRQENIFHIIDSLSVMIKDYLIISILKKDLTPDLQQISTNSLEAYRYYINGIKSFGKWDFSTGREWCLKAIAIDSNFTMAKYIIAFSYGNEGLYEEAKKWSLKLYAKKDQMTVLQKSMTNHTYACFFETPYEVIKACREMLEYDDQSPGYYWNIGDAYNILYQYDKAIPEFEKALAIYEKWGSKPIMAVFYTWPGYAYHQTGQYKKEKKLYKKAEQYFPNDQYLIYRQSVLSLKQGDTISANRYIEKHITISKENSASEADIKNSLAQIYSEADILDKAEEYYRQALSLEPDKPDRMNDLSYFLIDKNRNISEGLELVDKALESNPDDYNYLHNKGWGLYKQGNYNEALEILQKSWDLRMKNAIYDHSAYLHLEVAKKAVASQKNN